MTVAADPPAPLPEARRSSLIEAIRQYQDRFHHGGPSKVRTFKLRLRSLSIGIVYALRFMQSEHDTAFTLASSGRGSLHSNVKQHTEYELCCFCVLALWPPSSYFPAHCSWVLSCYARSLMVPSPFLHCTLKPGGAQSCGGRSGLLCSPLSDLPRSLLGASLEGSIRQVFRAAVWQVQGFPDPVRLD